MISLKKLYQKLTEEKCLCCKNKLFEETECPYFSGCCFCNSKNLSKVTKQRMLDEFCLGNYERCARYKLKQSGKEVLDNLHPWQGE